MSYDPEVCGAQCHRCPLKEWRDGEPVGPEINPDAAFTVIGEFPGEEEVIERRPFVGRAGNFLTRGLQTVGVAREQVNFTNVLACRPPGNNLKKVLGKVKGLNKAIKKENTQRKKAGMPLKPLIPTPMECCTPRLMREIQTHSLLVEAPDDNGVSVQAKNLLPAGNLAVKTLLGERTSVMKVRGNLITGELYQGISGQWGVWDTAPAIPSVPSAPVRVLPLLHPSFVTRRPRWNRTFAVDLGRAMRWFTGNLTWKPPEMLFHPSAEQLREFLFDKHEPFWAYDVETDDIECLTAGLRCIAIGTVERVVVVGFDYIDTTKGRHYPPAEEAEILAVLREFFEAKHIVKVGHNAGYYDRLVIENHLGVTPAPLIDTMLLHRLTESELPHNLGFVASMYTDVHAWKADREGKKMHETESDEELHVYCCYDTVITARVLTPVWEATRLRGQAPLIPVDHKLQAACAGMHKLGMRVDQRRREERERLLILGDPKKAAQAESQDERRLYLGITDLGKHLKELAEMPHFNPASHHQVREVLFEKWRLDAPVEPKLKFTDSGDPRTADEILRALLTLKSLTPVQAEFIKSLRWHRRKNKLLGTYVSKLRPSNMEIDEWAEGIDVDESTEEWLYRKKKGSKKRGIVDPTTGRCYPGYNAHVTTSGRLSSSNPINAQNIPGPLRDMFIAEDGNVLVGADADQLELRIAAARWNMVLYLAAFAEGKDPHSVTSGIVFGDMYWKAPGLSFDDSGQFNGSGQAKKLRKLAKAVAYASQYWAEAETVHRLLTKTEDMYGNLVYANLSLNQDTRPMHAKWVAGASQGNPGIKRGWNRELNTYKAKGYIVEPIHGRRRDFLDGENRNEIVNFPIQASASAIMNDALMELVEEIPFFAFGPNTGLINQCHDALVLEVPENRAEETARILEGCMNREYAALPGVKFTAAADISNMWKEVG